MARLPSSDPLREVDGLPPYKEYIVDLVTRLNGIRTLVYDKLVESREKSKKYYDRAINPRNFHIGDYVILIICIFGTPKVVLTDQDQSSLSKLITRAAKRLKIIRCEKQHNITHVFQKALHIRLTR